MRCPRCNGKTLTRDGTGVLCIACGCEDDAHADDFPDGSLQSPMGLAWTGRELHLGVYPSVPAYEDAERFEATSTPGRRRVA